MDLNHRQQKRAKALALQLYNAGDWYPCNCGLSGCMFRRTPRSRAQRIIQKQWKVLKLNDSIVNYALSMVSLVDD